MGALALALRQAWVARAFVLRPDGARELSGGGLPAPWKGIPPVVALTPESRRGDALAGVARRGLSQFLLMRW